MNQHAILSLLRLPARLDAQQAAAFLGFSEHDMPALIRSRLLKPLGNPPPDGHKFFSSTELEALAKDHEWLHRASKAVTQHWRQKNQQHRKPSAVSSAA